MVIADVRRIGRLFAVLLLVWTTVDLVDHDLGVWGAERDGGAIEAPVARIPPPNATQPLHVDHSFCCSHTVDITMPFSLGLTFDGRQIPPAAAPIPQISPLNTVYHPPLA
jgi:hypothetical protein